MIKFIALTFPNYIMERRKEKKSHKKDYANHNYNSNLIFHPILKLFHDKIHYREYGSN